MIIRSFGDGHRRVAPEHWGCTNLAATNLFDRPLAVEHHYGPHGGMREHAADEAILCVCIGGSGYVKVGDETSGLRANQAVAWPAGKTHRVWTEDDSMTVLLIHLPGQRDFAEPPERPS
jgi:mannose-6-phosphate isomerase-like protein (cupin superfamily)